MSGPESGQLDLRIERQSEEHGSERSEVEGEMTTEQESVKLALASLFSDSTLQGGSGEGTEGSLNVEDIPEKIRPMLLEQWKRLRSKLDSSKPRELGEPAKNAGMK